MISSDAQWAPPGRPDLRDFVPRERRLAPLAVWLACLAGALALLLWLGDGRLAAPDLTAPASWAAWARARSTAEVTVAVLRLGALGLAWYLVGVTSVSVLAHAARAAALVRVADALSFGPVRTVVQQALGVGLAVGVVAWAVPIDGTDVVTGPAAGAVATADDQPPADVGERLRAFPLDKPASGSGAPEAMPGGRTPAAVDSSSPPDAGPPVGHGAAASSADDRAAPMAPVPGPAPAAESDGDTDPTGGSGDDARGDDARGDDDRTGGGTSAPAATSSDATPSTTSGTTRGVSQDDAAGTGARADTTGDRDQATPTAATGGREVVVRSGDHLWGIAEQDLRDALDRAPTEAEVHRHWQRVVRVNADRLVVPTNPDLLQPGQRIALPVVEAAR